MKKYISFIAVVCLCCIITTATFTGCKKQALEYTTTSDVNIVDYLRRYPEQFSEYVKILDRTNISPFLNAYGTYTCFAPTNDAFKLYLKQIGKNSTDELDTAALSNICKLHLIVDTISTGSFTDGKLPSPTMYGQYLITGVNDAGATLINRQAILTQPNILTGNGLIHVIDHVLQPATLTIAKMIQANTNYKIFTAVLIATGFYDSLNIVNNPDTTRRLLTCLAEPDSILAKQSIFSLSDIAKKYKSVNAKNPNDSLYLYAAYHILPSLKYVADIVSAQSHPTLAPQSVVTVTLSGQTVLLNQVVFNGVSEAGIPIDRPGSDNSCTNGVLHTLGGGLILKVRLPYRVDFDLGDQPEIRKLTSIYRRSGKSQNFLYGQLKDVTWQNTGSSLDYYMENPATTGNYYWFYDGVSFNLRTTVNQWIEFKTPLIVKGRYKIWYCFRRGSYGQYTQTTFDGVVLPKISDFVSNINTTVTGPALEATGFKRYTVNQTQNNNFATLGGIVDVATTDRHTIRLTCIKDAGSGSTNSCTFDFIQFIPIDQDQLRPLFDRDGTIVP